MENHKLDKLLTSEELVFLYALSDGESVFHLLKSLHFCGFSLIIQTSPFQPLASECSVELPLHCQTLFKFPPCPPLNTHTHTHTHTHTRTHPSSNRCEIHFSVILNYGRKPQIIFPKRQIVDFQTWRARGLVKWRCLEAQFRLVNF